jgi:hypothetical protein
VPQFRLSLVNNSNQGNVSLRKSEQRKKVRVYSGDTEVPGEAVRERTNVNRPTLNEGTRDTVSYIL